MAKAAGIDKRMRKSLGGDCLAACREDRSARSESWKITEHWVAASAALLENVCRQMYRCMMSRLHGGWCHLAKLARRIPKVSGEQAEVRRGEASDTSQVRADNNEDDVPHRRRFTQRPKGQRGRRNPPRSELGASAIAESFVAASAALLGCLARTSIAQIRTSAKLVCVTAAMLVSMAVAIMTQTRITKT